MSRRARLKIAGQPFHVIQRGNNRSETFLGRDDFVLYLGLLNELAPLFECATHAYVLMPNHVHMLITPSEADGLSLLMKHLGQRYAQHFNRVHGRTGTLWEGRFKSSLVHDESYLFTCQRYIELNPVRARIVDDPWDYPWVSYRANAGREPSTLSARHRLYLQLGATEDERCDALLHARIMGPRARTREREVRPLAPPARSLPACPLPSARHAGSREASVKRAVVAPDLHCPSAPASSP